MPFNEIFQRVRKGTTKPELLQPAPVYTAKAPNECLNTKA